MMQAIARPLDFIPLDTDRLSRKVSSQVVPGAVILGLSALMGSAWMSFMRPAAFPHTPKAPAIARAAVAPVAVTPAADVASNSYGALFDPRLSSISTPISPSQNFVLGSSLAAAPAPSATIAEPGSLSQNFMLEANLESVAPAPSAAIEAPDNALPPGPQLGEDAPLPAPRPPEFGAPASHDLSPVPGRQLPQQNRRAVVASAPPDDRNFLEKLFGMRQQQPSGRVLAYAAPEDGALRREPSVASGPAPRYDRQTAVYDVSAHTVYMPDGTRLEAHSGLGDRMDDPRHVNERNRGATPPSVYELSPREQLFHGVQALRLKPVGGGDVYGRNGLLAHTYMLGSRGDSNGCVSFRNYNAFLQAFQNGAVRRLVVVARQ
jgi:hypothetical protein